MSNNDWIVVLDEYQNLAGWAFSLFFDRIFSVRLVVNVSAEDQDGLCVVTLDSDLNRNYLASPTSDDDQPVFGEEDSASFHASGFGVVQSADGLLHDCGSNQINDEGSCFYAADLRGLERGFADGFVEAVAPRAGMSVLPFLSEEWFNWEELYDPNPGEPEPLDAFAWIWFDHRSDGPHNYRHLIGASSSLARYGVTDMQGYHYSYVFREAIETKGESEEPPRTPQEIHHHTQDTGVHEMGHQFDVVACSDGHHDDEMDPVVAWCEAQGVCPADAASPELCEMNTGDIRGEYDQAWDPVMEFCEHCLFLGDPNCAELPPGGVTDGAIRTEDDPLF